eukprot:5487554-Prymnesium_polylepis.1
MAPLASETADAPAIPAPAENPPKGQRLDGSARRKGVATGGGHRTIAAPGLPLRVCPVRL